MNEPFVLGLWTLFTAVASESLSIEQMLSAGLVMSKKYIDEDTVATGDAVLNEPFILLCEFYKRTGETTPPEITWYFNGQPLSTTGGSKHRIVYNQFANEATASVRRSKVQIRSVTLEDVGLYECRASSMDDTILSRKMQLSIPAKPQFRDKAKKVAGRLGGEVSINCDVDSQKEFTVEILLKDGATLPDRYQRRDNNVLFVRNLTRDDQDMTVSCTATDDATETEMKTVSIDVYHEPGFQDGDELEIYGILNFPVNLTCRVVSSNPPVVEFTFLDGENPIYSDGEYNIVSNLSTQTSILHISKLNEKHFGKKFLCNASNGHFSGSQVIRLKETRQPYPPHMAFMGSDDGVSAKWKIEDDAAAGYEDVLPITSYNIKYCRTDAPPHRETCNDSQNAWHHTFHAKNPQKSYTIVSLRRDGEYAFRVQSVNRAGTSNWTQTLNVKILKSFCTTVHSSRFIVSIAIVILATALLNLSPA